MTRSASACPAPGDDAADGLHLFRGATFSGGEVIFVGAVFCGGEVSFMGARDWSRPPEFSWTGTAPPGVTLPKKEDQSQA
jgi:hypothetical protein